MMVVSSAPGYGPRFRRSFAPDNSSLRRSEPFVEWHMPLLVLESKHTFAPEAPGMVTWNCMVRYYPVSVAPR